MNKLTLTLLLCAATSMAQAAPFTPGQLNICKSYSELAGTIMAARQLGVSMPVAMEAAPDELTQQIVELAYEMPRFSAAENQLVASEDFADRRYLSCIKVIKP